MCSSSDCPEQVPTPSQLRALAARERGQLSESHLLHPVGQLPRDGHPGAHTALHWAKGSDQQAWEEDERGKSQDSRPLVSRPEQMQPFPDPVPPPVTRGWLRPAVLSPGRHQSPCDSPKPPEEHRLWWEPDRVLKGFRVLFTRSRDGELHSMAPGCHLPPVCCPTRYKLSSR